MWRHLRSYSGVPRFLAAPAAKANSGRHIAKALRADPTQAALFQLACLTWQLIYGPGNPVLSGGDLQSHNPDTTPWKGSKLLRGLSRMFWVFFLSVESKT